MRASVPSPVKWASPGYAPILDPECALPASWVRHIRCGLCYEGGGTPTMAASHGTWHAVGTQSMPPATPFAHRRLSRAGEGRVLLAALSGSYRDWRGPRGPHFLGALSWSLQRAMGAFARAGEASGLSRGILPSLGCLRGTLPKDKEGAGAVKTGAACVVVSLRDSHH